MWNEVEVPRHGARAMPEHGVVKVVLVVGPHTMGANVGEVVERLIKVDNVRLVIR